MQKLTYAVTGVASGIGAELARILRAQGHAVIGFDIHETRDTVDRFIALDLDDPDSIAEAAAAVDTPLDGLCNNAGLPPRTGLEKAILQVNFLGTRAFTQAMLPHLQKGGSIVNMASRAGHGWRDGVDQVKRLASLTRRDQLASFIKSEGIDATRCYNLSKEAMILWTVSETEAMVQRDLRVNSLSPGGIATGILGDFQKAFGAQMARNVARAGRPGTPAEIAEIAAFLLSPTSNWIKGTDIAIDGGMGAFNMTDVMALDVLRLPANKGAA
ncbi:coniferyl-alcohol dehydrogenase [Marinovum sp. 2_MG-2023]|uniref:coniferyl-alcohol dehydrogenase n=1 Tax=unclassified Marinovum TaxID=2647166 RepID=UPI0026E3F6DB|nr:MULTISPECIES: coniferyl-alcohol dehydrogenase [unclassified Marinovum]MDO6729164.1 coniferyl-alcohol dehydrogenase [Marinovum sp. 2_MG-2023]MDO6779209.1 coniferyl-alcohol dehydrogenase [Marinovum sp. 1_MG-2023]